MQQTFRKQKHLWLSRFLTKLPPATCRCLMLKFCEILILAEKYYLLFTRFCMKPFPIAAVSLLITVYALGKTGIAILFFQTSLKSFLYSPCIFMSLFLMKLQVSERLWHRYFPVDFTKFLRTSFLITHLRWLLLLLLLLEHMNYKPATLLKAHSL